MDFEPSDMVGGFVTGLESSPICILVGPSSFGAYSLLLCLELTLIRWSDDF